MLVALEEKLAVFLESVNASDLLVELRINDEMEVVIDLLNLSNVLVLHLPPGQAFPAWVFLFREADLVDNDVVDVDLKLGQLDGQALCLIKTEELRDAHSDEGGALWVAELLVDLHYLLLQTIKGVEHLALDVFARVCSAGHHRAELRDHAAKLLLHLNEFEEGLVQDGGEVEETQSVTCGSSVEDYHIEVVAVEGLYDLSKGGCFINAWY